MQDPLHTEYRSRISEFVRAHPELLARYGATEVQMQPEQIVLAQESKPRGIFILISGLLKVTRTTSGGQLFTLGVFERGEMVGDVEALLQIPHFCTVKALTDCTFVYLTGEQFLKMLSAEPAFNLLVHRAMASKMLNTSHKAAIQSTNRLFYSLLIVLRELSRLNELQISKNLLSEFLGTSVRNLNRLLVTLEQETIVQFQGAVLQNIQPTLLEKRIQAYEFDIQ